MGPAARRVPLLAAAHLRSWAAQGGWGAGAEAAGARAPVAFAPTAPHSARGAAAAWPWPQSVAVPPLSAAPGGSQHPCSGGAGAGLHTSAAPLDAARDRRLAAAAARARRRAAAAALPPPASRAAAPAPPPAVVGGGGALVEGGPLAPAMFDLPNEAALSTVLNRPALIITR
jgi:hypothetical protein